MRKLPNHRNPKNTRSLRLWHKRIGITSAFFVLLLAVTGLPLHHADGLGLTSARVSQSWLLDGYGIKSPENYTAFTLENISLTQIDNALYFNNRYLFEISGSLKGAVLWNNLLIAAAEDRLLLFTQNAELVDEIASVHGLPSDIRSIAVDSEHIVIATNSGVFKASSELDQWSNIQFIRSPDWSKSAKLNSTQWRLLQENHRQHALNWERVLLDLHSGRLFGPMGPWVMDIAALLFIVMAVTGIWIWGRKR